MRAALAGAAGLLGAALGPTAGAQAPTGPAPMPNGPAPVEAAPYGPPINDQRIYVHGLFSQLEGRQGDGSAGRWEGEGWVGGDYNRLWLKTEGEVARGRVTDGQQELYYSRPISTYFDAQVGGRYDLDSGPGRGWAAFGVEGFAPFYFTLGAHAYVGEGGRLAAKLESSNEIRFTQRLILEPQAELNLYSRSDRARGAGSGVSDLDAGLRLRYEVRRKFAPYIGVIWEYSFGDTADFARADGERADQVRLALGVRTWF